MHCEEELRLTRRCLEIISQYEFGVAVQTKSDRILQDIDLLDEINKKVKAVVQVTLTTFDDELCRIIEPNVCNTKRRIEILEENIEKILNECVRVGVKGIICFGMGLTLREGDREYYYAALDKHFPGLKQKYIEKYGNAYELPSPNSAWLMRKFISVCKENNIFYTPEACFGYMNDLPDRYEQMSFFDM